MENNIPPRRPPMPPSDFQSNEEDRGGNSKKRNRARKERFELNEQTKTFIILFTGIVCLAGAIFCFVKLFM